MDFTSPLISTAWIQITKPSTVEQAHYETTEASQGTPKL